MALVQPYLFFNGRCEEAIEFYKRSLGAELQMMMRNKDAPPGEAPPLPPGSGNKVMHATLAIGGGIVMASDGMASGGPEFRGFSLSLAYPTEAECRRVFDALGHGGHIDMPLGKTFWSPCFGMLTDRFGVGWMVGVLPA